MVLTDNRSGLMTSMMTSSSIIIIDTKRATSQTSLPVSFTEVLVSCNRCALLRYLHRLILASEPRRLPACFNVIYVRHMLETVTSSHRWRMLWCVEHYRHAHKRSSFMSLFGSTNTFDPMGLFFCYIYHHVCHICDSVSRTFTLFSVLNSVTRCTLLLILATKFVTDFGSGAAT